MWIGYKNSSYVSITATVLTVYFSMLTAYAIEVYNFKLKEFFRRFIYVLVLIPVSVSIIGFVQFMSALKLTNTFWPLIIPAIAAPPSVFFAEQYLKTALVKDLILSARIDGCGEFAIFHKIMMPMAKPGFFTLTIFAFVFNWNQFFMPSLILSSTEKYTVPLVVKLLKADRFRTNVGAVYTGIVLSVLPVIVVFLFLSKQIVGGLTLGAIKE
jgi:multiple sugar transport system permease protein